jgi:site-specific recombinase XerD
VNHEERLPARLESSDFNSLETRTVGLEGLPVLIAAAGERAARRFLEFFLSTIRNHNTRAAYARAVAAFLGWCEERGITELRHIETLVVSAYIEKLTAKRSAPTVKQHLAAIRGLFDWLVTGGIVSSNPAHAVNGPTHIVTRGKTSVLTADQARQLLDSIDTSTIVGLRDRAFIAVMVYSFARVSAVARMQVGDYYQDGKRWWLRLHEKGGKL